jgi:hypothetical protein
LGVPGSLPTLAGGVAGWLTLTNRWKKLPSRRGLGPACQSANFSGVRRTDRRGRQRQRQADTGSIRQQGFPANRRTRQRPATKSGLLADAPPAHRLSPLRSPEATATVPAVGRYRRCQVDDYVEGQQQRSRDQAPGLTSTTARSWATSFGTYRWFRLTPAASGFPEMPFSGYPDFYPERFRINTGYVASPIPVDTCDPSVFPAASVCGGGFLEQPGHSLSASHRFAPPFSEPLFRPTAVQSELIGVIRPCRPLCPGRIARKWIPLRPATHTEGEPLRACVPTSAVNCLESFG